MGKSAGLLREFLDSKAGVAFGKALEEKAEVLMEAFTEAFMDSQTPPEPVTGKPNPPIPVTKEVET